MKRTLNILLTVLAVLLTGACRDFLVPDVPGKEESLEGQMVMFSSGMTGAATKAAVPFMEEGGRFVCRMFYHAKASDTDAAPFDIKFPEDGGTMTTTWLKVNNTSGNCVYWNNGYLPVNDPAKLDINGFDKDAPALYWQNRLEHAFLALADYRYLKTATATAHDGIPALDMDYDKVREIESADPEYLIMAIQLQNGAGVFEDVPEAEWLKYSVQLDRPTETEVNSAVIAGDGYYYFWTGAMNINIGTQKDPVMVTVRVRYKITGEKVKNKYYAKSYDLRQDADVPEMTMAKQPDPIQAFTIKKPAGATPESNRVNLIFRHQFSQVQVNLRTSQDGSANVSYEDIVSVSLLGVTQEGYVYVVLDETGKKPRPSDFKEVETSQENPYGTKFKMFERSLTGSDNELGFIKSYESIAFGRLEAIEIVWQESGAGERETTHTVVFKTDFKLESGVRYIYNMELRRGTVPVVNPVIEDWRVDSSIHTAPGRIDKTSN